MGKPNSAIIWIRRSNREPWGFRCGTPALHASSFCPASCIAIDQGTCYLGCLLASPEARRGVLFLRPLSLSQVIIRQYSPPSSPCCYYDSLYPEPASRRRGETERSRSQVGRRDNYQEKEIPWAPIVNRLPSCQHCTIDWRGNPSKVPAAPTWATADRYRSSFMICTWLSLAVGEETGRWETKTKSLTIHPRTFFCRPCASECRQ